MADLCPRCNRFTARKKTTLVVRICGACRKKNPWYERIDPTPTQSMATRMRRKMMAEYLENYIL